MEPIAKIQIDQLTFPNAEKPALQNIHFEIQKGDFIIITGEVASGKSVLLHSITGAIPHFHKAELTGKVTILDEDISELPLSKMSDYVGYMMQEPQNQIISLNVYDDVAFGLENLELPLPEIEERVQNTLEFVGLKGYEKRPTASLSGGQAQRVVLAGVLALNAPILILDQPTAELDPQGRYELYKRLGDLNQTQNLTIVLVMDRIEEVITYANKVFYMKGGEIVQVYSPKDYYEKQENFIKSKVVKNQKELRKSRNHPFHLIADNSKPKGIVAQAHNLTYRYKNNILGCENISLKIYEGDFLAVVGLNGSGKSTLAKLLIGLLPPTTGEVTLFNQPLTKGNLTEIRSRMGFLFQNPDFQIFASSLKEEVGFSLKLRGVEDDLTSKKTNEALDFVGLLAYKELHPQRLSRGQRQLLALASILVSDPEFIIADEPTSGLDENQGYLIMDKLFDLAQKGKTILLITHDLTMAKYYSNRLIAMDDHQLKLDIPTADLHQHLHTLKTLGLDFNHIVSFKEVKK